MKKQFFFLFFLQYKHILYGDEVCEYRSVWCLLVQQITFSVESKKTWKQSESELKMCVFSVLFPAWTQSRCLVRYFVDFTAQCAALFLLIGVNGAHSSVSLSRFLSSLK